MDAAEIRQKIARKDRQFVFLKRQISPDQAAKVMALRIPGIFQQREYRRYYPAGEMMAHGHGMSVSLLQLARAYTVFANQGQLLPLSLTRRESQPIGKPVLKPET